MFAQFFPPGAVKNVRPLIDRLLETIDKSGYACVTGLNCTAPVSGPPMDYIELGSRFAADGWDTRERIDNRMAKAVYESSTFYEFLFGEV